MHRGTRGATKPCTFCRPCKVHLALQGSLGFARFAGALRGSRTLRRTSRWYWFFAPALALALMLGCGPAALAAGPPTQPKSGPGGSDYAVSDIVKKAYGQGSEQVFVFRPAGPAAGPRPVVVFLHGFGAVSPKYYGAWIGHLVRKGMIVVYPRYHEASGKTRLAAMTLEAAKGVRQALQALAADPEANPDLGRVAHVGHAMGAVIAVNLAALAEAEGLPKPRLVLGAMPARLPSATAPRAVPLVDLATLDPKTLIVMITGERDNVAAEAGARAILRASSASVPPERRLLARLPSDNHGQPALLAGHYSPVAPDDAFDLPKIDGALDPPKPVIAAAKAAPRDKAARDQARLDAGEQWRLANQENIELQMLAIQNVDAIDWYGLWKTFDIARETAFAGGDALTLRRDSRFPDMGLWSDGWPMRRINLESPKAEPHKP
jgi:acetyl esterase/lipase